MKEVKKKKNNLTNDQRKFNVRLFFLDDYSDAKENFPLSSTRECDKNIPVDFSKPVKAQSFIPPWYVNGNENYNPEDMSEAVEIARNLPEIDEDTVPSTWRPAE